MSVPMQDMCALMAHIATLATSTPAPASAEVLAHLAWSRTFPHAAGGSPHAGPSSMHATVEASDTGSEWSAATVMGDVEVARGTPMYADATQPRPPFVGVRGPFPPQTFPVQYMPVPEGAPCPPMPTQMLPPHMHGYMQYPPQSMMTPMPWPGMHYTAPQPPAPPPHSPQVPAPARQLSVNAPPPSSAPSTISGKQGAVTSPDSPARALSVHSACTAQPSDSTGVGAPESDLAHESNEQDAPPRARQTAPALVIDIDADEAFVDSSDAPEQYQPSPLGELLPQLQVAEEQALISAAQTIQHAIVPVGAGKQAPRTAAKPVAGKTQTARQTGAASAVKKPPGALCVLDTNALLESARACAAVARQAAAARGAPASAGQAPALRGEGGADRRGRRGGRRKPYAAHC